MNDAVAVTSEWVRALHGAHTRELDDGRAAIWAKVELLGHRQLYGLVCEVQIAGAGMLRVDVPLGETGWQATQFVNPTSLYALTPTTEALVRAHCDEQVKRSARLRAYEGLPALPSPGDDPADDEIEV